LRSKLAGFLNVAVILLAGVAEAADGFDQTLKRHLDAITARNSAALFDTVPANGPLVLILPNGRYTATAREYRETMQDWLGDGDWKWRYELVNQHQTAKVGWATLRVGYDDMDEAKQPYHLDYYLHLVFEKRGKRWLLVHDQNTRIPAKS
jgi:hypothetical protein